MAIQYKVGAKLSSTVCKGQVMALRIPAEPLDIQCGGAPVSIGDPAELGTIDDTQKDGLLVGKRYTDEAESMEFLCTRAGLGTLTVNGVALGIKQSKKLPSSD